MDNPIFSVIIPTYNRAEDLYRCLISLEQQTYKNFEVIVCDDGSTDHTKEVVQKFENLIKLKYNYSPNWGGPAKPRNMGISLADGEFLCFLDSDDWWYPEKLAECLAYTTSADFIYHRLTPYNAKGALKRKLIQARQVNKDIIKDLLLNTNAIPNSSVVVRKAILSRVGLFSEDKGLIAVEDLDYWLRIARFTSKFKFIDKELGAYWVGSDNISLSDKHLEREVALFNKHGIDLDDAVRKEAYKRLSYRLGRMAQISRNYKKALECYKVSIRCSDLIIIFKSAAMIFKIHITLILNGGQKIR